MRTVGILATGLALSLTINVGCSSPHHFKASLSGAGAASTPPGVFSTSTSVGATAAAYIRAVEGSVNRINGLDQNFEEDCYSAQEALHCPAWANSAEALFQDLIATVSTLQVPPNYEAANQQIVAALKQRLTEARALAEAWASARPGATDSNDPAISAATDSAANEASINSAMHLIDANWSTCVPSC